MAGINWGQRKQVKENEREKAPRVPSLQRHGEKELVSARIWKTNPRRRKSLEEQEFKLIINKWKMSVKKTGDFYKDKMIVALIE